LACSLFHSIPGKVKSSIIRSYHQQHAKSCTVMSDSLARNLVNSNLVESAIRCHYVKHAELIELAVLELVIG
jgi:hypothetical protein